MTCFVGLDVSQKMTAICVVDNAGRRLWRGQCPTVPEQIGGLVRRHSGDDARWGIETGAMTPWLVHELRNLGLEVICLDARHARAALEMQINKTDQNDAEGLAQIVRTRWYRSVHVKSFDSRRARALLGARTQLIGMTTTAWDASVERTPGGDLAQTTLWAASRRQLGFRCYRLAVTASDQKLIGGCMLYAKRLVPGVWLGSIPRGPLVFVDSPDAPSMIVREITVFARRHGISFLVISAS